jgi:hypothetical protein
VIYSPTRDDYAREVPHSPFAGFMWRGHLFAYGADRHARCRACQLAVAEYGLLPDGQCDPT